MQNYFTGAITHNGTLRRAHIMNFDMHNNAGRPLAPFRAFRAVAAKQRPQAQGKAKTLQGPWEKLCRIAAIGKFRKVIPVVFVVSCWVPRTPVIIVCLSAIILGDLTCLSAISQNDSYCHEQGKRLHFCEGSVSALVCTLLTLWHEDKLHLPSMTKIWL